MPITPAALCCFALVAIAPAAIALGAAKGAEPGRPALVLFAPWTDAAATAEAAGAMVIARGGWRGAALVWAPGDLAARMKAAGALAVLSADLAPVFCGARG